MNWILVSLLATLAAQEPQWTSDYGQSLEAARAARKPLLVVLDTVPPNEDFQPVSHREVAPLLKPYILCRIDVTTPYGQHVAKAFRAASFPHTAVIDNTGSKVLARREGALSESAWIALLTTYQTGQRPAVRRAAAQPPRVQPAVIRLPQPCFT